MMMRYVLILAECSVFQQLTFSFQNDFGLYMLFAALIFGFILSFAVGANDSGQE